MFILIFFLITGSNIFACWFSFPGMLSLINSNYIKNILNQKQTETMPYKNLHLQSNIQRSKTSKNHVKQQHSTRNYCQFAILHNTHIFQHICLAHTPTRNRNQIKAKKNINLNWTKCCVVNCKAPVSCDETIYMYIWLLEWTKCFRLVVTHYWRRIEELQLWLRSIIRIGCMDWICKLYYRLVVWDCVEWCMCMCVCVVENCICLPKSDSVETDACSILTIVYYVDFVVSHVPLRGDWGDATNHRCSRFVRRIALTRTLTHTYTHTHNRPRCVSCIVWYRRRIIILDLVRTHRAQMVCVCVWCDCWVHIIIINVWLVLRWVCACSRYLIYPFYILGYIFWMKWRLSL